MSARADLAIVGGVVFDGTGAPGREASIALRAGRIESIGEEVEAERTVDVRGQVVAPGFVDIHSHGDLVLAWPSDERHRLLEGRLAQGITTEVIGNCGLGASPLFGHGRDLLPQINGWMSPASYPWEWSDLDGYFAHVESLGLPVNVASLVPHGALRLGAHHLSPGETDAATRREMTARLEEALDQGALGLSSGLIYPPGMYTSTDELRELARTVARSGGAFTSHIRGSSETLLDAVTELVEIGRDTGAHVHHSHAEAVGRRHWSKLARLLEIEDRARDEGVEITRDMFPYTVAATMMAAIYPPWSLEGGVSRLLERLADSGTRARIEKDVETRAPEWPPWGPGGWPHNLALAVGWEGIRVSSVGSEANADVEGLTLAELGRRRGRSPFDSVSDLMIEEDGRVGQFVLDITGEEGLAELIDRPDVAFITDANDYGKGKPHPAAYGSFPRVLGRYVRERGHVTLAEAIRRMTSLPADILGLEGRGRLAEGAAADLVVFDPDTITDEATLGEPRRNAAGISHVLVNGVEVFARGESTGATPGVTLRGR